jgi:hypothetical protein
VIRLAARSRVLARIRYHGAERLVEAYSLRRKRTGNVLLYAHERTKDGLITDGTRAYKVDEIESASTTDIAFAPRYYIEI